MASCYRMQQSGFLQLFSLSPFSLFYLVIWLADDCLELRDWGPSAPAQMENRGVAAFITVGQGLVRPWLPCPAWFGDEGELSRLPRFWRLVLFLCTLQDAVVLAVSRGSCGRKEAQIAAPSGFVISSVLPAVLSLCGWPLPCYGQLPLLIWSAVFGCLCELCVIR